MAFHSCVTSIIFTPVLCNISAETHGQHDITRQHSDLKLVLRDCIVTNYSNNSNNNNNSTTPAITTTSTTGNKDGKPNTIAPNTSTAAAGHHSSICRLCGTGFPYFLAARDHVASIHARAQPRYRCADCLAAFFLAESLDSHPCPKRGAGEGVVVKLEVKGHYMKDRRGESIGRKFKDSTVVVIRDDEQEDEDVDIDI
jgi:hypothetical protein